MPLYPTYFLRYKCDGTGALYAAYLAPGPGQVLSDGGHQAPGHLRPRGGAGRGQEAHAGHYRDSGVQWLDALTYFQAFK